MTPVKLSELARFAQLAYSGADTDVSSVSLSTQALKAGGLFVALKGSRFDGHDFINQAFEKGAAAALCSREIKDAKGPLIIAPDVTKALGDMARAYFALHRPALVVAVTGSVGKTTTKDYCASVLSQQYKTLKTSGNFNNQLGLPLTVFELEGHEAAVFELGMSDFGEISYLTNIVKPDIAVITNIGMSHAERLGSREGILKAKCEIFEGMKEGGFAILNGDDKKLRGLAGTTGLKEVFFGIDSTNCRVSAGKITQESEFVSFRADMDTAYSIDLTCVGRHNIYNILPACVVGLIAGLEPRRIKAGIDACASADMRLQVFTSKGVTIIKDCYNASPDSMEAALAVLKNMDAHGGRRAAVLGDMRELGASSDLEHTRIGRMASDICERVFVTGASSKHYLAGCKRKENATACATDTELADALSDYLRPGDIVLFKASRAARLEQIIELYLGRQRES